MVPFLLSVTAATLTAMPTATATATATEVAAATWYTVDTSAGGLGQVFDGVGAISGGGGESVLLVRAKVTTTKIVLRINSPPSSPRWLLSVSHRVCKRLYFHLSFPPSLLPSFPRPPRPIVFLPFRSIRSSRITRPRSEGRS